MSLRGKHVAAVTQSTAKACQSTPHSHFWTNNVHSMYWAAPHKDQPPQKRTVVGPRLVPNGRCLQMTNELGFVSVHFLLRPPSFVILGGRNGIGTRATATGRTNVRIGTDRVVIERGKVRIMDIVTSTHVANGR
jgi:hypothetical protein